VSIPTGIGVVGVALDCPAILGESGMVGAAAAARERISFELVVQQLGVAGVSLGGPGVFGLSLGNDLKTDPEVHKAFVEVDSTHVVDAGVEGLGLHGPGVRGLSGFERGGVFESTPENGVVAQLRLIPIPAEFQRSVGAVEFQPPTARGEAGDLLALNYRDRGNQRTITTLWFCTEGVSTNSAPVWVRVV
jgi:hypothetical protein